MNARNVIVGLGFLLLVVLAANVGAETQKMWDRTIGGSGIDQAYGVAVDSNNNIIIAGSLGPAYNLWTIKYDSNGNQLWNKTFGSSADGYDAAVDSLNNVIVTGKMSTASADYLTVKYDSDGNQLWNKTFGGDLLDVSSGVAVDSNNSIIVTGYTATTVTNYDCLTVKYSSNGSQLWNRTIGGDSTEYCYGVAVDSNNSVFVVGYTQSFGAGGSDVWVIKYDSNGNQVWNKTTGGSGYEYGYGIGVDSSDNIAVASYAGGDFWTIKYNVNGTVLWNKTAGGSNYDWPYGATVDSNNNIIVTGYTRSFGGGDYNVWTIKYDSNGNQLWNKTWVGAVAEEGHGVAVDSSNNIIVVGYTNSTGAGSKDFLLIKYGTPNCDDGLDNDANGLTDCSDAECANTPTCQLWSESFTPQPTIVTLQGSLTNASSGASVTTASIQAIISNASGQVWNDTFNNTVSDGVFNIPLGAAKELNLTRGSVYSMVVKIDVGSTTFVTADVTFGDGSPAADIIKFTA